MAPQNPSEWDFIRRPGGLREALAIKLQEMVQECFSNVWRPNPKLAVLSHSTPDKEKGENEKSGQSKTPIYIFFARGDVWNLGASQKIWGATVAGRIRFCFGGFFNFGKMF